MTRQRDIAIFLVATATFVVSLVLFGRAVGYTSPWFALIAMFDMLGFTFFARPLFVLRMPRWLRELRAWEVRGRLYQAVGVPAFGVLLRRTPLRNLQPLVYLSRYPGDPTKVQIRIEGAEAAHFWAAALLVPYMVFAGMRNWWSVLAWFVIIQVIGNVYPILHLRWVRSRLRRVLDRKLRNPPIRDTSQIAQA